MKNYQVDNNEQDKIDQAITISDQAKTGDITLIGKLIQVVNRPAEWQDAFWRFLSKNIKILLLAILCEALLCVIYLQWVDAFLIPLWVYLFLSLLLATMLWGLYYWQKSSRTCRAFTILASSLFFTLIGWQGLNTIDPKDFDAQSFGIVLAEIGEGARYKITDHSQLITDQIYNHILNNVVSEYNHTVQKYRVVKDTKVWKRKIEIRRIGVISNFDSASYVGYKHGAEIVIWGQLVKTSSELVTIRIYAIETSARTENPNFPVILPVVTKATDVTTYERDIVANDPTQVKQAVTGETSILSPFLLGLMYYLDQNFADAIRELEQAAVKVDQMIPTNNNRPKAVTANKCQIEGISSVNDILQKGVSSQSGKALIYYYLGEAYHQLYGAEEGQIWLAKAQQVAPDEPAIALSLAFGYRSMELTEEFNTQLKLAQCLINERLKIYPNDINAIYDNGIAYFLGEQPAAEIIEYEKLLKLNPDFYIAYINLGYAQAKLKQFERATTAISSAIKLAEINSINSASAWLALARITEKAGDPESARKAYKEAINRAPSVYWHYYYYAQFLKSLNELDAASLAFQNMLNVSDNKAWAYQEIGNFYRDIGLPQKALDYYQQSVHADSESVLARTYLAETYYILGQVEDAWRMFDEAAAMGKNLYYVYSSYGWHLYKEREFRKAAEMYKRSLTIRPTGEEEKLTLAEIYVQLDQCQDARDEYSAIVSQQDRFSQQAVQEAKLGLENLKNLCDDKP